MYNPITNTIGTTDRPQKQSRTTKIRIDPQFKSFVKFNTVWNFKKVHAQHCKGHFAPMPHWKSATTEKTVCTVCGSQQIKKVIKYNPNEPRKHRPQVIKQSNKTYEVVFEGYISKKLLRVDNPDQDHRKPTFENTCLSCELGFNGKSINGLCPSCANNERSDVNTVDYDTHASSHAGYVELWQQGQYDEVQSDAVTGPNMKQIERVLRERDDATTIREFTEKYYLLKGMMDRRRKAAEHHETQKYYAEMNKDVLFDDVRTYERRIKEAGKNAFERMHPGKEEQEPKQKPYVLMVTGHRPQKIPNSDKVKIKMLEFVKAKQEEHPEITLVSGMALGVDTMFAEIGLKLGIPVIAFVPFKAQAQRWPKQAQKHYNDLLNKVMTTITVCKEYSNAAYFKRNDAMVHASNACLAIWDGSTGGTMHAVHSAQKKGINTTIINP